MNPDYLEVNRLSWNNKVDTHLNSDFYNLDGFINGESSLKEIEMALLGNIKGKKILHLQCHFGQDSISLSRKGALVTGIDLSDKAIDAAKNIAAQLDVNTKFVCSDVYSLPDNLDEKFDIVFTSYGTISWLPDLNKWGEVIAHFLKPEGKFVFAEFHPAIWMYDDDFTTVAYNYFGGSPIIEEEDGSYADRSATIRQKYVCWNHGIGNVVSNLIGNGLHIDHLEEYDYAPYNFVKHMIEFEPGKFRIEKFDNKTPYVYSIVASKLNV